MIESELTDSRTGKNTASEEKNRDKNMFRKSEKSLFAVFVICSISLLSGDAFADPAHMADAIMRGDMDRVKNLIEEGADVNAKGIMDPPLSMAAMRGNEDIVRLLIGAGADVNAVGRDGQTALHKTRSGNVAELLIANGANVNAKTSEDARWRQGWTPLHMAVSLNRRKEVAQLLIAKGADINAMNADGETPLDVVKWSGKDMAELLIANGAAVSNLHTAVYIGDFAKVKSLIAKGVGVTTKDKSGRTALFYVG